MPLSPEEQKSVDDLTENISFNKKGELELRGVSLPSGWKFVEADSSLPFKIKAQLERCKLFVKLFSPEATKFADVVAQLLDELAKLPLPIPILAPLATINNVHVFRLGLIQPKVKIVNVFQKTDIALIENAVSRFDLRTLYGINMAPQFMKLETILIDGRLYIIDPFDDSVNAIEEYNEIVKQRATADGADSNL